MRFDIAAEPSAALLCRLIGLAAQHDLAAPEMRVRVTPERMSVRMSLTGLDARLGAILAEKIGAIVGVTEVARDGVALPAYG